MKRTLLPALLIALAAASDQLGPKAKDPKSITMLNDAMSMEPYAIVMPRVLDFSKARSVPRLAQLARAAGLQEQRDDDAWLADAFVAWVRQLNAELKIPAIVEKLAPQLPGIKHYVLMTDRAHMPAETRLPNLLCYDELLEAA